MRGGKREKPMGVAVSQWRRTEYRKKKPLDCYFQEGMGLSRRRTLQTGLPRVA